MANEFASGPTTMHSQTNAVRRGEAREILGRGFLHSIFIGEQSIRTAGTAPRVALRFAGLLVRMTPPVVASCVK